MSNHMNGIPPADEGGDRTAFLRGQPYDDTIDSALYEDGFDDCLVHGPQDGSRVYVTGPGEDLVERLRAAGYDAVWHWHGNGG